MCMHANNVIFFCLFMRFCISKLYRKHFSIKIKIKFSNKKASDEIVMKGMPYSYPYVLLR